MRETPEKRQNQRSATRVEAPKTAWRFITTWNKRTFRSARILKRQSFWRFKKVNDFNKCQPRRSALYVVKRRTLAVLSSFYVSTPRIGIRKSRNLEFRNSLFPGGNSKLLCRLHRGGPVSHHMRYHYFFSLNWSHTMPNLARGLPLLAFL